MMRTRVSHSPSSCRFLVLEYVEGGELFDYLVKSVRLRPSEVWIIGCVALGNDFLSPLVTAALLMWWSWICQVTRHYFAS